MTIRLQRFAIAAIIVLFLLIPLSGGFEDWAPPMDEGSLLVYPELILKGQLPYRNFETFYGPANLFILSGAYAIFGPSVSVERSVGLLYRLLILVAVFGLTKRWGSIIAGGCMILTGFLLVSTGIAAYAWIGAVACGLCSLWVMARPESPRRCFFAGLLGGCTLLFRVDLGPAVVASALPLFLQMDRTGKRRYFAGICVGLLPLLWLALVAGPGQIINNLFLFPVIYSSPGRHLPIFSTHRYVLYFFFAHLVASMVNVAVGIAAARRLPGDPQARLFLGLALFALCLTHQAVQRIEILHVSFAAFLSLGLLPITIVIILSGRWITAPERMTALCAVFAAAVLVETFLPERTAVFQQAFRAGLTSHLRSDAVLELNGRSFPVDTMQTVRMLDRLLAALRRDSSPGERLFVGPADLRRTNNTDTFLYHMMPQLRPASYFLEMNPFSANRPNSRLATDVASADWLVLNRAWDSWHEQNESGTFGSAQPNAIVQEKFELRGEYGSFLLFRRKPAM